MMLGMIMVLAVMFRIVWGLWGSRYARFTSFALRPEHLFKYFKDMFTLNTEKWAGHNPASSWAAITMLGLALGLGFTGYMMASGGDKEFFEEAHELFGNAFIIVVVAHVAGVVLHTIRHKDGIAFSMIHGNKNMEGSPVGIEKSHGVIGILFVMVVGLFVFQLNKNYDPANRTLNMFGVALQLGENEENEIEDHEGQNGIRESEGVRDNKRGDDDDDDDDD